MLQLPVNWCRLPKMGSQIGRLLVFLSLLFWSPSAWAQSVLLVEPTPSDATLYEAFGRARAELTLHDFQVVVLKNREGRISAEDLEAEAQARSAFAAVALQRSATGTTAEVCIVDRLTGKTVQRKLTIDDSSDGPNLLAIRAVDLLRASLLELSATGPPPADVVGVDQTPLTAQLVSFAYERKRFEMRAGALVMADPTLGWSYGITFSLHYRPVPRLSLGLKLSGPVFGGKFVADEGRATIRQESLMMEGSFNVLSGAPDAHWECGPSLGLGVSHLHATGHVQPPLLPQSDEVWSFAMQAGLFVEYLFDDSLSLATRVSGLGLLPQPVIAVAEARSAPVALQGVMDLTLGLSW